MLGSATLTAFIIQAVTGIILATMYIPSTGSAYDSLQLMDTGVPLGGFVRAMHDMGASAMVVLITAHVIRVFLTGSFKFPRELNWLTGVGLLLMTVILAFTGQLLRWDSNGMGSLFIATEMAGRIPLIGRFVGRFFLGGQTLTGITLSRLFAIHVFIVPAFFFMLLGIHLYLVLHNGISEPAVKGQPVEPAHYRQRYEDLLKKRGVPFWPDALWRDLIMATLVIGAVLVAAWVIGPTQLSQPPDPTATQVKPRPDWYFIWIYAMQAIVPHTMEPYIIILLPTGIFVILLAIPFIGMRGDRALSRRPWTVGVVAGTLVAVALFTFAGYTAPWTPTFRPQPLYALTSSSGQVSAAALRGQELFQDHGCIMCHSFDGVGGLYGPDLTHVAQQLPEATIKTRINKGWREDMPAFQRTLTATQVDDIVQFLETSQNQQNP